MNNTINNIKKILVYIISVLGTVAVVVFLNDNWNTNNNYSIPIDQPTTQTVTTQPTTQPVQTVQENRTAKEIYSEGYLQGCNEQWTPELLAEYGVSQDFGNNYCECILEKSLEVYTLTEMIGNSENVDAYIENMQQLGYIDLCIKNATLSEIK